MSCVTIATEHHGIHIEPPTSYRAIIEVATCAVCKHPICPGCGDWCDKLVGTELNQCCQGVGKPTTAHTILIWVTATEPELIQEWTRHAKDLISRLKFVGDSHTNPV